MISVYNGFYNHYKLYNMYFVNMFINSFCPFSCSWVFNTNLPRKQQLSTYENISLTNFSYSKPRGSQTHSVKHNLF